MAKTLRFPDRPTTQRPPRDIPIVISEGAWRRLQEHKISDDTWQKRTISGLPGFVVIMVDREVLERMNKLDLNPTAAVLRMTGSGS